MTARIELHFERIGWAPPTLVYPTMTVVVGGQMRLRPEGVVVLPAPGKSVSPYPEKEK